MVKMMKINCKNIQYSIEDLLDGQLESAVAADYQHHIESCKACQQVLAKEQQFREVLRESPVPAASPGFESRVFANVRHAYQPKSHKTAFYAGFGTAMAAGVLLFFLSNIMLQPQMTMPVQDAMPQVTLSLYQPKKVNMVFNVPEAVAAATISMELPEHVQIAGYQGHQIEWQTALKAGKNLLSLPIVAQQQLDGEIIARIRYGNSEKEFRMRLNIQSEEDLSIDQPATQQMIIVEQETV